MDWQREIEEEKAALKRVVATLLALAMLAGLASFLPQGLRRRLLCILRPAEMAMRDFLAGRAFVQNPPTNILTQDSPAAALRLASSFRTLALEAIKLSRQGFERFFDPRRRDSSVAFLATSLSSIMPSCGALDGMRAVGNMVARIWTLPAIQAGSLPCQRGLIRAPPDTS